MRNEKEKEDKNQVKKKNGKERKQKVDLELRLRERESARGIACLSPRRFSFPLQITNIAETNHHHCFEFKTLLSSSSSSSSPRTFNLLINIFYF